MADIETRRLCHACGQFHVFRDDLCWGCIEAVRRLAAEYETFGQDTPEPATNALGETR
ncbi:MAG: hypothetical protein QG584_2601 [Pseudomonadota bacterium]|nr:hypothetical protein [Pseudomonadota bacterium]MDQ5916707.1 hypothetical protein [Pseudomonadota bacterium]MDQ5918915.1 hypothetical protein [Pseudomonadota bacterium]